MWQPYWIVRQHCKFKGCSFSIFRLRGQKISLPSTIRKYQLQLTWKWLIWFENNAVATLNSQIPCWSFQNVSCKTENNKKLKLNVTKGIKHYCTVKNLLIWFNSLALTLSWIVNVFIFILCKAIKPLHHQQTKESSRNQNCQQTLSSLILMTQNRTDFTTVIQHHAGYPPPRL